MIYGAKKKVWIIRRFFLFFHGLGLLENLRRGKKVRFFKFRFNDPLKRQFSVKNYEILMKLDFGVLVWWGFFGREWDIVTLENHRKCQENLQIVWHFQPKNFWDFLDFQTISKISWHFQIISKISWHFQLISKISCQFLEIVYRKNSGFQPSPLKKRGEYDVPVMETQGWITG